MNPQTIKAWLDLGVLVATNGLTTITTIRGIIKALNPGMTDQELNKIVEGVQQDARERKAKLDAFIKEHEPPSSPHA